MAQGHNLPPDHQILPLSPPTPPVSSLFHYAVTLPDSSALISYAFMTDHVPDQQLLRAARFGLALH